MHGVSDIGLMSPSSVGGWIFGTGVMFESFQIDGTYDTRHQGHIKHLGYWLSEFTGKLL